MSIASRPEERAARREIEQSRMPGKVAGTALSVAGSLIGGGAIAKRIAPFLSSFIPSNIAAKGLGKIEPRLGKFFNHIVENGYNYEQGLDYLRNAITGTPQNQAQEAQPSQQPAQPQPSQSQAQQMSPFDEIDQYSPEISSALRKILKQGYSPRDAAARLKVNHAPEFGGFIQAIEQNEGQPFPEWINALFGGKTPPAQPQAPQPQMQASPRGAGPQPQAGSSANAQKLMSLIQQWKTK